MNMNVPVNYVSKYLGNYVTFGVIMNLTSVLHLL
jgi:hypothetical protein